MSALLWSTFPNRDSAARAAEILVSEELAACGNILGGIESIFVWQGAAEHTEEVGLLLKTNAALLGRAAARLEAIHPYDTPAVLGWPCAVSGTKTAPWLESLRPSAEPEAMKPKAGTDRNTASGKGDNGANI